MAAALGLITFLTATAKARHLGLLNLRIKVSADGVSQNRHALAQDVTDSVLESAALAAVAQSRRQNEFTAYLTIIGVQCTVRRFKTADGRLWPMRLRVTNSSPNPSSIRVTELGSGVGVTAGVSAPAGSRNQPGNDALGGGIISIAVADAVRMPPL